MGLQTELKIIKQIASNIQIVATTIYQILQKQLFWEVIYEYFPKLITSANYLGLQYIVEQTKRKDVIIPIKLDTIVTFKDIKSLEIIKANYTVTRI